MALSRQLTSASNRTPRLRLGLLGHAERSSHPVFALTSIPEEGGSAAAAEGMSNGGAIVKAGVSEMDETGVKGRGAADGRTAHNHT